MSMKGPSGGGLQPGRTGAAAEGLPNAVRMELARDMLRWALPPLAMAWALFTLGLLAMTGISDPARYGANLAWAAGVVVAWALARRGAYIKGALVVCVGMLATTGTAVVVNSVYAPAFVANLLVMTIAVPVFGLRAGVLIACWALLTGGVWLYLDDAGLSAGVRYISGPARYALVTVSLAFGASLIAVPSRLLGRALAVAETRVQELEALRAAEAATDLTRRAILEQIHGAVLVLGSDGRVSHSNGQAAAWFDEEEEGLRRLPSLAEAPCWLPQERPTIIAALDLAIDGESSRFETVRPRGAGKPDAVFDVRVSPFASPDGKVLRILVEVNDVSDLMRARAELARARRLEIVGQLSGSVAHDFNNMLSAILSATELLDAASSDPQVVDRKLVLANTRIIRQAGERAADMTRKLLAIGRADQFQHRVLDLNELVRDMAELLQTSLGRKVTLQLRLTEEPLTVLGDAGALEHALLNLCINGRDAMQGGGVLTVRTARLSLSAQEAVERGVRPGLVALVSVSDTGMGISDEVKSRLFEPFFTTKPTGKGSGLGLAAVLGTAVGHGGALDVASELGHGATFRLYLPQSTTPMESLTISARTGSESIAGTKILVVDDEELTRRSLELLVRAMGAEVATFADGSTALSALRERRDADLVLCDVMMQEMDGPTLAQILDAEFPTLPVIMMTGYMPRAIKRELPAGRDYPLLRKPFQLSELRQVVMSQLRQAKRPPPGSNVRSAS